MTQGYIVVLITAGSAEEAEKIAMAIVKARLAACVNVLAGIRSFYWWKGMIEDDSEVLLIVKTREALFPELLKMVKSVHSYEVPEVIALPIKLGNTDYLQWLSSETQEGI